EPEQPDEPVRPLRVTPDDREEEAGGHQDRRQQDAQGQRAPGGGHAGEVDVQAGHQPEDDQHAGVSVPCPEERLLQVVGRDRPTDDPQQEGAAVGYRDDGQQDDATGLCDLGAQDLRIHHDPLPSVKSCRRDGRRTAPDVRRGHRCDQSFHWKDYRTYREISNGKIAAKRYHHGDLRRAMLAAAAEAIEAGGVGRLSIRSLARATESSHTAFRHHLRDRRGLLTALAAEGYAGMTDALRAVDRARPEGFLETGVAYIEWALAHPAHFQVMFRPDLVDEADPALQESLAGLASELMLGVAD